MRSTWVVALTVLLAGAALAQAPEAPDEDAKLYVVGMGTAVDLLTLRGAAAVERCDVVVLEDERDREPWAELIAGKEVIIAAHGARVFYGVNPEDLEDRDMRLLAAGAAKVRADVVSQIRAAVEAGKCVGALQWGDAMMYGATWYMEMLGPDFPVEVIPGVGAMQAATAAVQRNPVFGYDTNSVIVTMSDFPGRVDANDILMDAQTALVVYTMHFDWEGFFAQLNEHYPPETPVAVVEWAGVPGKENVIRSTVGTFMGEVDYPNLAPDAHLLLVGKFLECGQARVDGLQAGQEYVERMHGGLRGGAGMQ